MMNHNRKSGRMPLSFRRLTVLVVSLFSIIVSTQSAMAALTIGALTVRSDSTLNSSGAAASLSEYADLNTTGNVTLGKAVTAGNITIGNASSTSGIIVLQSGATTTNAVNVTANALTTGAGVNVSTTALTEGSSVNITSGAARTSGAALKVTDASLAASVSDALVQLDVTGTKDTNTLDIDVSGAAAASGNELDITYSTSAHTGNAVDLNMGTNVAGDALNIATAATTGNAIDITTSGVFQNELIDINVGAQLATGDAININLGSTAVASQALVVTSGSSTATDGLVDVNLTTTAGQSADALDINVTSGAMNGNDTIQGIDLDITGAVHTSFNTINGIGLSLTTESANASETAILIEGNWDNAIAGGTASGNNNGPAITIIAGGGSNTGTGSGGRLTLLGGDGGGSQSGNGGSGEMVQISGGSANGTAANSGGDVRLWGGNRTSSGAFGSVIVGDASNQATTINASNAPVDPRESLYIEGRLEIGGNLVATTAAANSIWDVLTLPAKTYTITGSTQITNATGFNVVNIGQSTVTDVSAITIDQSASLYVANAPAAAGSVTITNPYALWVDGGASRFDGIVIQTPQALTVADNGNGGTAAEGTLTVTGGVVEVTCSDAQGCNITMSETGAKSGQSVKIVNIGSNNAVFADTPGVSEIAGAFTAGQYDSIELVYSTDRWVQVAKSDN